MDYTKQTMLFDLILSLLLSHFVKRIESVAPYSMNMHKTDPQRFEEEDRYCIYYTTLGYSVTSNLLQHSSYPYCIRINDTSIYDYQEQPKINSSSISFSDLRKRGITSYELFLWSAPMDIIEDYQIYLTNISSDAYISSSKQFYNCTWPTFGPTCQFWFDITHSSFDDLIKKSLLQYKYGVDGDDDDDMMHLQNPTSCYIELTCDYLYPFPLCLDWREVCDGTVHCLNGAQDEKHCFELELNECTSDKEYRCHNGAQCIPRGFWHDDSANPDCLDRSDEVLDYSPICYVNPSMRCEEHACRPGFSTLACGDGSCDEFSDCPNGRSEQLDIILHKKPKHSSFDETCLMLINCVASIYSSDDCECIRWGTCAIYIQQYCPPLFRYPLYPVAPGHIHFLYTNNQSYAIKPFKIALPTFICYDENLCPAFKTSFQHLRTVRITIANETWLHCHNQSSLPILNSERNKSWHHFQKAIQNFYTASCLTFGQLHSNLTGSCSSHLQSYQCNYSKKCISKHRLLDSVQDCPLADDEEYEESCSLINSKYRFKCVVNGTFKCISPILFEHDEYDCLSRTYKKFNDAGLEKMSAKSAISFQTLCDGFQEREPLVIAGQPMETDETHCNYDIWPCNNTYTHCDGYWNCANGLDELGCLSTSSESLDKPRCNAMQHVCVSPHTLKPMCLDISRVNDGTVDCLGAFDERYRCRNLYEEPFRRYQCSDDDSCYHPNILCDGFDTCENEEDELICQYLDVSKLINSVVEWYILF